MAFAGDEYKLECANGIWFVDPISDYKTACVALFGTKKFVTTRISEIRENREHPFGFRKSLNEPLCPHFGYIKKCNSVIYNETDNTWSYTPYYLKVREDFEDIRHFFEKNMKDIPFDNSIYEDIELTEKLFEELLPNPVNSANKRI